MMKQVFGLTARVQRDSAGQPELLSRGLKFKFRDLAVTATAALALLEQGDLSEDEIVERACGLEPGERDLVRGFTRKLAALGLLSQTVFVEERALLKLVHRVHSPRLRAAILDPTKVYALSRFCHLRPKEGRLVLESPLSLARIEVLHPEALVLIERLSSPRSLEELCRDVPSWTEAVSSQVLSMLLSAGFAGEADSGVPHAREDLALQQWEFHDLLFHARSRFGRHDGPVGRTYHFRGKAEPLPALRPEFPGPSIELHRPDMSALMAGDRPFTQVMEARQSVRRFGQTPMSHQQLGEFLFRAARVRKLIPSDGTTYLYETSERPYPGGGGCYELEIYPVVDRCEGLDKGLYHYDPQGHRLVTLPDAHGAREALLREAERANGTGMRPQVLLVLTARFQRVHWKYQTMAYSAILKNVGVLYQSMYLVATAMGLGPCALGGGDPEPLRAITGDEYWVESSVGEFMLGSMP